MKKAVIIYPHGGGGSWLSNLIYHLETNDESLPAVELVFDHERNAKSIDFFHGVEWYQPNKLTILDKSKWDRKILFSCVYAFNVYVNDTHKIQYNKNMFNYSVLPMIDQFHALTDNARHFISDINFKKFYCTNIDLDYSLVFQNPKLFITNLFNLLDELNVEYSHNIEYCLASIKNYRKTCLNPADHYGCYQSLIWLAWCHSLCLINNIQVNESLDELKSLSDLTDIFAPYQPQFLEMSKQHIFNWKD